MPNNQIIYNAIECPDGTILESHGRHDYNTHLDAKTGEVYMGDGGKDYLRRSVNKVPAKELSVYNSDSFAVKRQVFAWGSYGKDGKQPKHWIKLKDMELQHIMAILETQQHIYGTYVEDLFLKELEWRIDNVSS